MGASGSIQAIQAIQPLWYATNTPDSAARAARQNMNLVTLLPSKDARGVLSSYKDAWNAAHAGSGKKMPRAGVTRHVYVGETDQQARERGMFGAKTFYESLVYLWKKSGTKHLAVEEVMRASEATLYTGTPATVRAKIQEDLEESGANYFVPRFAYGNLTHEESVRSLELFTKEVMPHFQK